MVRMPIVAALVAAVVLPAASQAGESDAATVQALHDEAGRLFDARRFEEARQKYLECREAGGPPELIYLVGRCFQEMERWEEAAQAYREYLQGEHTIEEAVGRAAMALRAVEKVLATGTLLLGITPSGAVVHIDGAEVGRAPVELLGVAPGTHELRVEAPGCEPLV